MDTDNMTTRRDFLKAGLAAGVGVAAARSAIAGEYAKSSPLIMTRTAMESGNLSFCWEAHTKDGKLIALCSDIDLSELSRSTPESDAVILERLAQGELACGGRIREYSSGPYPLLQGVRLTVSDLLQVTEI